MHASSSNNQVTFNGQRVPEGTVVGGSLPLPTTSYLHKTHTHKRRNTHHHQRRLGAQLVMTVLRPGYVRRQSLGGVLLVALIVYGVYRHRYAAARGDAWEPRLRPGRSAPWQPPMPWPQLVGIERSPVSDAGLVPCGLAVVLTTRENLSLTATSAVAIEYQKGVCHFHLFITALDSGFERGAEMQPFVDLLARRPRTNILWTRGRHAFNRVKSVASLHVQALGFRYVIFCDKEVKHQHEDWCCGRTLPPLAQLLLAGYLVHMIQ